jgi:channel protein (hemolysin III family)
MTQINAIPGFAEPVAAWTHLLGVVLFLALTWPLLRRGRGSRGRIVSLAAFAFACLFVLSMSTVYHMLDPEGGARAVVQRLDHAAIFTLIAGTVTPIHAILFRGVWRWGMLVFIWAAAITGIVLKTVFFAGVPPWLGVLLYVCLGWVGVVSIFKIWRGFGWRFAAPIAYGGLMYTLGAGTLGLLAYLGGPMLIQGVVGRHELFHLAVLAGMGFHWQFVRRIADGSHCLQQPLRSAASTERAEDEEARGYRLGEPLQCPHARREPAQSLGVLPRLNRRLALPGISHRFSCFSGQNRKNQ